MNCIFQETSSYSFTNVTVDDDLLELALGHLDESLSPVYSLSNPDSDYTMLIPFDTTYRSPAKEVSVRASRDGIKWIRIPTHGVEHSVHEEIRFAKIKTRKYSYITLVYGIRKDRLEVPAKGKLFLG